jgi:hypothetical protein
VQNKFNEPTSFKLVIFHTSYYCTKCRNSFIQLLKRWNIILFWPQKRWNVHCLNNVTCHPSFVIFIPSFVYLFICLSIFCHFYSLPNLQIQNVLALSRIINLINHPFILIFKFLALLTKFIKNVFLIVLAQECILWIFLNYGIVQCTLMFTQN